jgi:hypothetical protein
MKLDKLFQVLVVGGAVLGTAAAGCGRGVDGGDKQGTQGTTSNGAGADGGTTTGVDGGDDTGGTGDPGGCGVCCWLGG